MWRIITLLRRWSSPKPSLIRTDDSWPPKGAQEFFYGALRRAERQARLRILLLIVFGALGTLARYGLQGEVQDRTGPSFPVGTLIVNLLGCFLLGCLGQFALQHLYFPPDWRIAITVGFFGAFTTFSSFSWETIHMLQDSEWTRAAIYVAVSVVGGLFLTVTGMRLANHL